MKQLGPFLIAFGLILAAASFLPLPFAWIFLAGAGLCFIASRGGSRRAVRKGSLGCGVLFLLLGIGEVVLNKPVVAAPPCAHDDAARATPENPFDGELGYGPVPSTEIPAVAMPGGGMDFGGVYTIDEHGQRRAFPSEAKRAVLFFGGSFTFGLGVPDEATTAYVTGSLVSDEYRVYNFAYGGYGPHQMLAAIQAGRVDEVVEEQPAHVVYQLIMNHVRRTVGRTAWNVHDPRYVPAEDGFVVRDGRHCDPPAEPTTLEKVLRSSAIYRKATDYTSQAHIDTMIAVVDTARREVESRYPGCAFHVILWDTSRRKSDRILAGLLERGIDVHLVSDILPGYAEDEERYCNGPEDPHPNPEAHRLIGEYVVREILGRAD